MCHGPRDPLQTKEAYYCAHLEEAEGRGATTSRLCPATLTVTVQWHSVDFVQLSVTNLGAFFLLPFFSFGEMREVAAKCANPRVNRD